MIEGAAVSALVAVVLDAWLGDPVYRWHPVRMVGMLIGRIERSLFSCGLREYFGGGLLALFTLLISLSAVLLVLGVAREAHPLLGFGAVAFFLYSSLGLGDLVHHVRPIAEALDAGRLDEARDLTRRIVSRDVDALDSEGVARASIESLGENFVDAWWATLFWFGVGALAGATLHAPPEVCGTLAAVLHRCVNTMDAMVGYRHAPYARFGTAAARLDDLLNWLPARTGVFVLYGAALFCGEDENAGWRITRRDRRKHASPNSAYGESFFAGALHIGLGGPNQYHGSRVDRAWLGTPEVKVDARHVRRALRLVQSSGLTGVLFFVAACLLIHPFL
ncbi:MAG: adenosylcobinamide-phosphate synthase CbiB [Opitutales bacterium]